MVQSDCALSTILRPARPTGILYIPEIHHVRGNYFPELTVARDTSRDAIVADLASAQHEDVIRVLALDLATGRGWDASQEIAQAVLEAVLADHARVPAWCMGFLETHLGVAYVHAAERQAA